MSFFGLRVGKSVWCMGGQVVGDLNRLSCTEVPDTHRAAVREQRTINMLHILLPISSEDLFERRKITAIWKIPVYEKTHIKMWLGVEQVLINLKQNEACGRALDSCLEMVGKQFPKGTHRNSWLIFETAWSRKLVAGSLLNRSCAGLWDWGWGVGNGSWGGV